MQCRSVEQNRRFFIEQGTVGGQDDPEAESARDLQKAFKLGVQQRLSHQVEVEIVGKRTDLAGRQSKLLFGYKARLPFRAVTERTGKIADVGYFKKCLFEHITPLLTGKDGGFLRPFADGLIVCF